VLLVVLTFRWPVQDPGTGTAPTRARFRARTRSSAVTHKSSNDSRAHPHQLPGALTHTRYGC